MLLASNGNEASIRCWRAENGLVAFGWQMLPRVAEFYRQADEADRLKVRDTVAPLLQHVAAIFAREKPATTSL
jgi:hypothetical protein